MGNGQLLQSRNRGEQQKDAFRIRTGKETRSSITAIVLLTCLFPAAILSLLTFSSTSWYLQDAISSSIIQSAVVAGTVLMMVVALTVAIGYPNANN
jgi:uncharacterized membrane protein